MHFTSPKHYFTLCSQNISDSKSSENSHFVYDLIISFKLFSNKMSVKGSGLSYTTTSYLHSN